MFIALLVALLFMVIFNAIWRTRYWQRRAIRGPRPLPFLGNIGTLFVKAPASILQLAEWSRKYGRIYGIQIGPINVLVTSDPTMVRQVMVTKYSNFSCHLSNPIGGDLVTNPLLTVFDVYAQRWKRVRSCLSPFLMSMDSLHEHSSTIWDCIGVTRDALAKASADGNAVDLYKHLGEMTTDIIGRMLFGAGGSRQYRDEFAPLARGAQLRLNNNAFEHCAWMWPWLGRKVVRDLFLRTGQWRKEPVLVLYAKLNTLVEQRKQQMLHKTDAKMNGNDAIDHHEGPSPFLDALLSYESDEYDRLMPRDQSKVEMDRKLLAPEEIVMATLTFILAGFGVANSMSLTFLMLARNPRVQQKLREEIQHVCTSEVPTLDGLDKLEYAHAVQLETLRLFPVASPATGRVCVQDAVIGDNLHIPRGTVVWPDVVTMHRDRQVWGEDAEEFRPERWLKNGKQVTQPPFLGFGDGPRICFGRRLAPIEEKMVLVQLLRAFDFQTCAQTESKSVLSGHAVLAAEQVLLRLEPREARNSQTDCLIR